MMAEMRFSSSLIADPDHFTAEPEIKVYSDPFFCSFFIRIVLLKGQCYEKRISNEVWFMP